MLVLGVGTQRLIHGNEKLLNFFCYLEHPNCLTFDDEDAELIDGLSGIELSDLTDVQLEQIFKATSRAELDLESDIILMSDTVELIKNKFNRLKAESDEEFLRLLLAEIERNEKRDYWRAYCDALRHLDDMLAMSGGDKELIDSAKLIRKEIVNAAKRQHDDASTHKFTDIMHCVVIALKTPDDFENVQHLHDLSESLPGKDVDPGLLLRSKIQAFLGIALLVAAFASIVAFSVMAAIFSPVFALLFLVSAPAVVASFELDERADKNEKAANEAGLHHATHRFWKQLPSDKERMDNPLSEVAPPSDLGLNYAL